MSGACNNETFMKRVRTRYSPCHVLSESLEGPLDPTEPRIIVVTSTRVEIKKFPRKVSRTKNCAARSQFVHYACLRDTGAERCRSACTRFFLSLTRARSNERGLFCDETEEENFLSKNRGRKKNAQPIIKKKRGGEGLKIKTKKRVTVGAV